MLKALLRGALLAAIFATAAGANDVCRTQLTLEGGIYDPTCAKSCPVTFYNPQNVTYIARFSYIAITNMTADMDRVEVQVDLRWSAVGKLGSGDVWVAGWPPQSISTSGNDTSFANGTGNFEGMNEPLGSQLSFDTNGAIGPSGLAFITYSQQGVQPKNVRWGQMSTGPGRIRASFWYLTDHASLMNWIAVQPSNTLVCGL